jgi:hypothetical protein
MLAEIIWDKQSIAVLGAFAVPIVAIVMAGWYKIEQMRSANNLKRKMIERGMSVDEIERVIKAVPPEEEE